MVSSLPPRVFRRVVLAWFVYQSGRPSGLENSQRQICSRFNRSNRKIIGSYLKEAREFGFIRLLIPSDGLNPDVHTRGAFFDFRTRESDRLIQLSNSLWGPQKGILHQWPYLAAWGHGCTPPTVILCLAVLNVLDEPIQKRDLRTYLQPLVPESSFNEALTWIRSRHLTASNPSGLALAQDWHEKFIEHLRVSPAGELRKRSGDERRRLQSERNRTRVKKSSITKEEQEALRLLKCVWKDCPNLGTEMEHFPPRRFLKHLADQTNRHVIWSICEYHNDQTQSFIKSLPVIQDDSSHELIICGERSKWDIYDAVSNLQIQRFYSSFSESDQQKASLLVRRTVILLDDTLGLDEPNSSQIFQSRSTRRDQVGPRAHQPFLSKI